jgi:hypothetical protein
MALPQDAAAVEVEQQAGARGFVEGDVDRGRPSGRPVGESAGAAGAVARVAVCPPGVSRVAAEAWVARQGRASIRTAAATTIAGISAAPVSTRLRRRRRRTASRERRGLEDMNGDWLIGVED